MIRRIRTIGDPVLRSRATPIRPTVGALRGLARLISDMTETMIDAKGVGIAAPQVGIGLRVAIVNGRNGPFPVINPRVVRRSIRTATEEEGCLSIPGVFGLVRRPKNVTVAYSDPEGKNHQEKVSGLLARVFQHEIDHLNGILFIDRTKEITHGTPL